MEDRTVRDLGCPVCPGRRPWWLRPRDVWRKGQFWGLRERGCEEGGDVAGLGQGRHSGEDGGLGGAGAGVRPTTVSQAQLCSPC